MDPRTERATMHRHKPYRSFAFSLLAVVGLSALAHGAEAEDASNPVESAQELLALVYSRSSEQHWGEVENYLEQATLSHAEDGTELSELVDFGLEHDASLRAAYDRWQAALHAQAQARALPDPRLTYTEFLEDIQTRTGPQRRRLSASQTFPGAGKRRLKGEIAASRAQTLWWHVAAERLRVIREVKRAHWEYGYLAQAIRITENSVELMKRLEPVVQRRVQAGDGQENLLRLLVEIGKLENEVLTLQDQRPALSARLDAVLNRRSDGLHPWPKLTEPAPFTPKPAELRERMATGNPELLALRSQAGTEQRRGDLARRLDRPDTTVAVSYMETGEAIDPKLDGSGDDPLSISVTVSVPVWRAKYRAALGEAHSDHRAALATLRERHNQLTYDLEHALSRLADADRRLRLYRDSLMPRARRALTVTEAAYRAGTAGLLDVIDSQRVLLEFEKSYWQACRNHEQRLADIAALCGGSVS